MGPTGGSMDPPWDLLLTFRSSAKNTPGCSQEHYLSTRHSQSTPWALLESSSKFLVSSRGFLKCLLVTFPSSAKKYSWLQPGTLFEHTALPKHSLAAVPGSDQPRHSLSGPVLTPSKMMKKPLLFQHLRSRDLHGPPTEPGCTPDAPKSSPDDPLDGPDVTPMGPNIEPQRPPKMPK